jgi:CNT family concentrative nucleoside transporter
MDYLRGLIGIAVLLTIAYLLSSYRKKIDWKLVATGIALQIVIALVILKIPVVRNGLKVLELVS